MPASWRISQIFPKLTYFSRLRPILQYGYLSDMGPMSPSKCLLI